MINFIKKSLLSLLRSALARRHHLVLPEWEIQQYVLAKHLQFVFARYEIDTVVDVGGNLGQYAALLRDQVGFVGTIITIEPVSYYASVLKAKSADDSQWHIVQCALGNEDCMMSMNITQSPGLNSLLPPRRETLESSFWADSPVIRTEEVKVRRLDDVLRELGIDVQNVPTYLKLDTQGYDLEVLKGATSSLPFIRALQTEASVVPIYENMPTYLETIRYIEDANFHLSGLFPVSTDTSLQLVEFDCIAVNSNIISGKQSPHS